MRVQRKKKGAPSVATLSAELLAQKLAEAKLCHHQRNDLSRALPLYEEILASHPGHVEALHGASLIHLARNEFAAALDCLDRAIKERPDIPVLHYNSGLVCMGQENWAQAVERFQVVLRMQPTHVQALCQCSRALLQQKRLDEAALLLQQGVRSFPEQAEVHDLFSSALRSMEILPMASYHRTLAQHYAGIHPDRSTQPPQHTLFLDRRRALTVALQNNLVPETIQTSGRQLCFHRESPAAEDPDNLIPVPQEQQAFEALFCATRWSQPTAVDFDPADPDERALAGRLAAMLYNARRARAELVRHWEQRCQETRPEYVPGQPLRVFIPASRTTDVMMFNARDLAEGFRQLGCEVGHCIEGNNKETYYFNHYLQAQAEFNPHVVLDINNYFKLRAHPQVLRVLWYTDPMPLVMRGQPLPWRPRDLIYSLHGGLDHALKQCGATGVERQGFCYNSNLFRNTGQPRKRKIVLVASAHDFVLAQFPKAAPILAQMAEMFEVGEPMTDAVLAQWTERYAYSKSDLLTFMWGYTLRNGSARWLCELADEIDVEVYGHRWHTNEKVRPFYKGVLPHGPAVAALYNEATHVFVPHPYDLQSQRLVEVSACGAIPVVYDCRYRAEPPHWDEQCLWYRTRETLRACLTQVPTGSSRPIHQGRSYTEFAQRILERVASHLSAASAS
ncbi:MAG: tetratricopeptide repeat protein [Magnetococcales bacterium]|nr:tetratricopeptide repeat protein [Magnetococcales bacterium]